MVTVEKKGPSVVDLVTSEISDFCAVLGEIGAPATPEAIQAALMSRILPLIPAEPLWVGFDPAQGVDYSVPVAWTDKEELRALAEYGCAYIFKIDPANPYTDPRRQIMLCRSQPKPVAVLPEELDFDCELEKGEGYDIDEEPHLRGRVDGFNEAIKLCRELMRSAGIDLKDSE